jgi:hypothetical protein
MKSCFLIMLVFGFASGWFVHELIPDLRRRPVIVTQTIPAPELWTTDGGVFVIEPTADDFGVITIDCFDGEFAAIGTADYHLNGHPVVLRLPWGFDHCVYSEAPEVRLFWWPMPVGHSWPRVAPQ